MKKRNIKSTLKKGMLSKNDKGLIEQWQASMDVKDIAQRLNRAPHQVEKYLREFLAHAPRLIAKRSETEELRRELGASEFWPEIRKQFTDTQLVFYENSYIAYRRQFKDLTSTEFSQLHQLITIDIFMSTHNIERAKTQDEIDRLERVLKKEKEKDWAKLSDNERNFIARMEDGLLSCKVSITSKLKEYDSLGGRHNDLLKSLKSTRDQRIKSLEDRGKFIGLLKELEVKSRRQDIAEILGLVDLSVDNARDRLMSPHKYKDGEIDSPLLNCDTPIPED